MKSLATWIAVLLLSTTAACTDAAPDRGDDAVPTPTGSTESPEPTESGSPDVGVAPKVAPTPTNTLRPPHPVSLPAYFLRDFRGGDLRLEGEIGRTDAYVKHRVSYRSDDLRVSGTLSVPFGDGPHPALVLAHGYIDPAVYTNGRGMMRYQDWLARAGYAVLHTDYRNHAFSGTDPDAERHLRLGYTADVINAVQALRATRRVPVDDERVGLVGRSMGGGVIYNVLVAAPGLVDAAVVFAPVSSRAGDNFDRWTRDDPGRSELSDFILEEYGDPRDGGRFWRQVSPRTFFDRITEPVMIHHGTSDDSCPIAWSRETDAALRRAGVDATFHVYEGEEHSFTTQWPLSMERTTRFLDRRLGRS